jgi:pimeloyl-ACP methyl ester carboxylesterase
MMISVLAGALAALVGLWVYLLLLSPGRVEPVRDGQGQVIQGSLAEKIHVPINGVEMGMIIKSADPANPVLLFVHGGPGMPTTFLTQDFPTGLEQHFTLVLWEQRGAGMSFEADIPPETMTAQQFVDDTIEVTRYLRARFGKQKIYLLGHSWGSYIAIQAAQQAPELYEAYIGVAQMTHQIESEQMAYAYMLAEYQRLGDGRMVRKLESAPVGQHAPLPKVYDALRDEAMHRLGVGTMHTMDSVERGVFLRSWGYREYSLSEKIGLWRGKLFSRGTGMWDRMLDADMRQAVPALPMPVYFMSGVYDYTVAYPLTREYLGGIQAPLKGFYSFERSAHSPMFEEPERFNQILLEDVLAGKNTLADDR